MINPMKLVWSICTTKKYFQFIGRANRQEYWSFIVCILLLSSILEISYHLLVVHETIISIMYSLLSILSIVPTIAVGTRRFHDLGLNGWWQVPIFTLFGISMKMGDTNNAWHVGYIICFIVLVIIISLKGTPGPNKYGEEPE